MHPILGGPVPFHALAQSHSLLDEHVGELGSRHLPEVWRILDSFENPMIIYQ